MNYVAFCLNKTDPVRQSSKIITFKMRQNFCYEYEFDFHGTKRTLSHLNCLILLTWMGNQGCEERTMITCTDRSYLNVCVLCLSTKKKAP